MREREREEERERDRGEVLRLLWEGRCKATRKREFKPFRDRTVSNPCPQRSHLKKGFWQSLPSSQFTYTSVNISLAFKTVTLSLPR